MLGQFSIYIQETKCSFFFFFLCYGETWKWKDWADRVFTIPVLHQGNILIPGSRSCWYWDGVPTPGKSLPCLPANLSVHHCCPGRNFCPSRSSQCSHSSTQFCQGDNSSTFSSRGFWFPFASWVFLTDCGAEWAGNELHLDRWSLNSQHCYYSHGGIME